MGMCVDQVYFVEKWNNRQKLKISISEQFSYISRILLTLQVKTL